MTKISVLTTVKNGEPFILEMLNSVRNQMHVAFEHIVVDDGSMDNTFSVLKKFKEEFKTYNLVLIKTQGIGRGRALNLGVSKAQTDWIAIIDADDIWHKMKLKIQCQIIEEHKNIDVLGANTDLFSKSEELVENNEVNNDIIIKKLDKMLLYSNQISHSSVLIKKELCNYDENRKSQFDYELWLRLKKNGYVLARTKSVLSFHRIHEMQQFESKMKNIYRIRSFKLKVYYSFLELNIKAIFYNTFKLIFDLLFPRMIRLKIRVKIKNR
jgi:teichuronic acid biosynthesis glycosyltransferase TuaG